MILRGSTHSLALEMETGITVVTPPNPEDRPMRVAYLLHGLFGSHGDWTDFTLLPRYALDRDIVFVMPEAGRSFYADMTYGQRFYTYVADELPELCLKTFNISSAREDTAVLGGSMGGYGALKCALGRPERFGLCGAFASACLFLGKQVTELGAMELDVVRERMGDQLVRDFQAILGESVRPRREDEALALAEAAAFGPFRPRVYACCGDADDLRAENAAFAAEMTRLGFDYTYEEWAGGHDWTFFGQALARSLDFLFGPAPC